MSYKQIKVAHINDLKDGQMKAVDAGDDKILLARLDGQFYATGAYCPHYMAPLADGILSGSRVMCPWHHACFDVKRGALLEPPSRDALPHYDVMIEGEDVVVSVPDDLDMSRVPDMTTSSVDADQGTIAIIGGGAAGQAGAQALREGGFQGRIVMFCAEDRLPYDRPNVSKAYLQDKADESWMPLRSEKFYDTYQIDVKLGQSVTQLDAKNCTLQTAAGKQFDFDKALIATGGQPRRPDVPGANLEHIFTMRTMDDADQLKAACEDAKHVVIIGASFIALEAASSLAKFDVTRTVVAPEAVPYEPLFGREIGKMIQKQHEQQDTEFKLGRQVKQFSGNGRVQTVELDNGETLPADVVIIGIGVTPATDFVTNAERLDDGSLLVNQHFQVNANVYAAGDVATFPDPRSEERIRIEHWRTAEQQGRVAGLHMAGRDVSYRSVPFFWTRQAGMGLQYVGHADDWDDVLIDGSVSKRKFVAYYVKDNRIVAALGSDRSEKMAAIEELMRLNKMPTDVEIRDSAVDVVKLLKSS